jgi:hypothetical protein
VVKGEKVGVRVSMLFVVKVPSSNRNGWGKVWVDSFEKLIWIISLS